MANTSELFRNGAVGFIDWLDGLRGNLSATEDMMVNVQICQRGCRSQTDREDTVAGWRTPTAVCYNARDAQTKLPQSMASRSAWTKNNGKRTNSSGATMLSGSRRCGATRKTYMAVTAAPALATMSPRIATRIGLTI